MKTILIVDDDFAMVDLLKRYLSKDGYEIISENMAMDAIERIKSSTKIDLIISDLRMPNIPGIDVIHAATEKSIPSIIITGEVDISAHLSHLKILGYKIDEDDLLQKPINMKNLLELVKKKLSN